MVQMPPLPSAETDSGKAILEKDRTPSGSLGIAIFEAVELAAKNDVYQVRTGERSKPRFNTSNGDWTGDY